METQRIYYQPAKDISTQVDVDAKRIAYFTKNADVLNLVVFEDSIQLANVQIPLKEIYNRKNKGYSYHCLIRGNRIAIFAGSYLFIYQLTDARNAVKETKVKLKTNYDFFNKSENSFYAYTYHTLNRNFKKGELFAYNFKSKTSKLTPIDIDFPVATSISPNNYFDPLYTSDESYLLADVGHYRIRFYRNGELIDSIVLNDPNLFKPISTLDSIRYRRVQANHLDLTDITDNNAKLRGHSGHIWSVYYLTDSLVFVRLSQPAGSSFELADHLWKKENNKWSLQTVMEINPFAKNNERYWPYFALYNRLMKNNDKLDFFHFTACSNVNTNAFASADYFKSSVEFSQLCYVLWRFQLK